MAGYSKWRKKALQNALGMGLNVDEKDIIKVPKANVQRRIELNEDVINQLLEFQQNVGQNIIVGTSEKSFENQEGIELLVFEKDIELLKKYLESCPEKDKFVFV